MSGPVEEQPQEKATPDGRLPGWIDRDDHGSGVFTLSYPDGSICVEHLCVRTSDGATKVHAPALGANVHQVHSRTPLTVTPSVLCHRCGLHGFITDGEWRAC